MSTYLIKQAIIQLNLTDSEVATYVSALNRRMNAAADVAADRNRSMPPMDPFITDLQARLTEESRESVLYWMLAARDVLVEIASERFITQNSHWVPR